MEINIFALCYEKKKQKKKQNQLWLCANEWQHILGAYETNELEKRGKQIKLKAANIFVRNQLTFLIN